MSALSHIVRDMKVTAVYLANYLPRRMFRSKGTSPDSVRTGLRVSMHAGSLGERNGRSEFTGIGRSVDAITTGMLELSPELSLRMYTEGKYLRPEAGNRFKNIPCRTRTSLAVQLGRDMAREMPDILHLTESSVYYSHLLPALMAPAAAVTVHDTIPIMWPGYMPGWCSSLYRNMLRRICSRCAIVFVHSEHALSDLKQVTGMACSNAVTVPLGVDPRFHPVEDAAVSRARERYGLPAEFVLTVGRCAPHKNLERLVRAMHKVRDSGSSVGLMIAGPNDGAEGARSLERLIKELNAASWVCWPGFVADADLPALYCASAAFAFPSLYEGFGLPLLEAMACEVPVVSSRAASLPEVAGDAALLVDAADTEALASGLLRVLNDKTLRADLLSRGRARAAQFRWETTARTILDAYNSALRREPAVSETQPLPTQL